MKQKVKRLPGGTPGHWQDFLLPGQRRAGQESDGDAHGKILWPGLLEAWKPDLEENYPGRTDEEYYGLMHEINDGYFDDERASLDIQPGAHLDLPYGIPTDDTYRPVMGSIDTGHFSVSR